MLKKRIIPCLDIKNGRTVKGVNYLNLQDAGNPVELAMQYAAEGADELVFLDIAASSEQRNARVELVQKIAEQVNIPFTVGGGINAIEDVSEIIRAGADKVSVNTSAVRNPSLITAITREFGSQCVVAAIDAKYENKVWKVFIRGGQVRTELGVYDWARQAEQLGAGELLITSMDHDGTKSGFATELLYNISRSVNIPVIASGGAGTREHFRDVFLQTGVSAALAAGIFHFGELRVSSLKTYLKNEQIAIR